MTSTPPGVSATPQSALNVVRQASGVATGAAAGVSLALNGATLGPDNAYAELAAFGQTTLGAADSVDALTQTTAANSAAILQMQNQLSADSNNGVNVFLNFGASGASLAGFTGTITPAGHGTLGIVGGYATLTQTVAGPFTGTELYTETPTNGDEQLVSAVFATKPVASATNILICRSDVAGANYVFAAIGLGKISLFNVVSGTASLLDSVTIPFAVSASYSIVASADGTTAVFSVLVNGVSELTFEDSANVTSMGADYRYCGFGLAQNGGAPSQVATFGFIDDAPGELVGDMFTAESISQSTISLPNSPSWAIAPANFYSTIVYQTSNYTYDPTTNKLTVNVPSVYIVKVSAEWSPPAAATYGVFGVGIFKNGILFDFDQGYLPSGPGPFFLVTSGVFIVPVLAGDYLQPGLVSTCNATAGNSVVVGVDSRFFCSLLNSGVAASSS